jgi:hypothetical protein
MEVMIMNDWVVEVKDFEEEILEGLYTLLNENGINKVKDLINLKNKQIQELTNNWNELEEWLLNHYEVKNKTQNECIDEVLDKMKEIKDGNNEK